MSNWTQPQCGICWELTYGPTRTPYRLVKEYRQREVCCTCGRRTRSGIYIRVDPSTVPYPQEG